MFKSTNPTKKFSEDAQRVVLHTSEKDVARKRVLDFMDANPLPVTDHKSSWLTVRYIPQYALVAVIILATTSLTAEASLPGDFLYPVKLVVNDKIIVATSITPESKAHANISLTKRRLDETVKIVASGKAEKEHIETIKTQIKAYKDGIDEYINTQKSEDEDITSLIDVTTELNSVLGASEIVLQAASDSIGTPEISDLNQEITKYKTEINTKVSEPYIREKLNESDPEVVKQKAEENLDELENTLSELQANGLPEEQAQALEKTISEHEAKIESGDYSGAVIGLENVEQILDQTLFVNEAKKVFEESVSEK